MLYICQETNTIKMEKRKTPLSFQVIYWVMNIITGLFLLVCVGVIVFYVMLWTDFFGNDLQLKVDMPGQVNFINEGIMEYEDGSINVELVEASTRIHFVNTPVSLARKFTLVLMGVCAFMFFILWTFRQFVARVRRGEIFTIDNILGLQNISYVLVGFWVYVIVVRRLTYHYLKPAIDMENVEFVSDFDNYPWMLLAALFLWVLSHIFLRGLRLKEEQELTI